MNKPPAEPALQREVATDVVRRLRVAGHEAFFVGGCVRELLLGELPADFDVTTSATPDAIETLFAHVVPVGRSFGVMTVIERGVHVEVATFRTEGGYADGRRPDHVQFATAEEDVHRRDLTINALLYDPIERRVIDHVGGEADLRSGIVRTVGDPDERFAEDHLRLLRAVRFTARLSFTMEHATMAACRRHAPSVARVAPERVRDELTRMLAHPSRATAFRLLDDLGLLAVVLPEVTAMRGVAQPQQFHPEGDVLTHTMIALDKLRADASGDVAWAVLLHDVGKPATFTEGPDRIRFHGHDVKGAEIASAILERLRFSNASRDLVVTLVRKHLLPRDVPKMRTATLRRLVAEPWFDDLVRVARADALAGSGDVSHLEVLGARRAVLGEELPPPLVTGRDISALGLPGGPAYARILDAVRTEQLEGELADREQALARLRELVEQERAG